MGTRKYSNFSAMLTYSSTEAKRPRNEVVSEPYDDLENRSIFQDNQEVSNHVGIFDLEYVFDNGMKLHNQLQYSEGQFDYRFAAPYQGIAKRDNENFSNDIRLNFGDKSSEFSGVAGVFYWDDKTNNKLNNVFGNADADLRHTSFAPTVKSYGASHPSGHSPAHSVISLMKLATMVLPATSRVRHQYEETFTALLPKVALSYDLTDNVLVGAMISEGNILGAQALTFAAANIIHSMPNRHGTMNFLPVSICLNSA